MHTLTIFLIVGTIFGTMFAREITVPSSYKFNYGVEDHTTGDVKSHYEVKVGNEVSGVYTLKEADGTTRIVKYTAGPKTGFNAVVEKLGQSDSVSSTLGALSKFGSFSGQGLNFHGFDGLQGIASEPVAAILVRDEAATPGYDLDEEKNEE